MRIFNTTGPCIPEKHYMVDLSSRLAQIKDMVDAGQYFVINRARQYGKTTTLFALSNFLKDSYIVLNLDFQNMSQAAFATEGDFVQSLARIIMNTKDFEDMPIPPQIYDAFKNIENEDVTTVKMERIFRVFSKWCQDSSAPVILIIDEVDTATNNQVFLDFLAQLRSFYFPTPGLKPPALAG